MTKSGETSQVHCQDAHIDELNALDGERAQFQVQLLLRPRPGPKEQFSPSLDPLRSADVEIQYVHAGTEMLPMATYKGFVPYLFYEDAAAAIEWYSRVFGFQEIGRWNGKDGKIQNAEMRVGSTELWLDGGGKLLIRKDDEVKTIWIGLWVDDVDAVYRSITSAGVETEPPVTREFGVEMLNINDPFGYSWGFMRRV